MRKASKKRTTGLPAGKTLQELVNECLAQNDQRLPTEIRQDLAKRFGVQSINQIVSQARRNYFRSIGRKAPSLVCSRYNAVSPVANGVPVVLSGPGVSSQSVTAGDTVLGSLRLLRDCVKALGGVENTRKFLDLLEGNGS